MYACMRPCMLPPFSLLNVRLEWNWPLFHFSYIFFLQLVVLHFGCFHYRYTVSQCTVLLRIVYGHSRSFKQLRQNPLSVYYYVCALYVCVQLILKPYANCKQNFCIVLGSLIHRHRIVVRSLLFAFLLSNACLCVCTRCTANSFTRFHTHNISYFTYICVEIYG